MMEAPTVAPYNDMYTSRRRTRIYQHPDDNADRGRDELIGQTQAIQIKPKLFDGLSVAQIIAGAAAAATSVALASYIGLAGSIIGAAVSSVVTVVSSQLYRRFLDASARTLKAAGEKLPQRGPSPADGAGTAAVTAQLDTASAPHARIAPSKLRARAAAARAATQRKVIVFSVLVAAVAVAACAAAILLGTAGEGIGEKTEPIFTLSSTAQQAGETSTASDAEGAAPLDTGGNDTAVAEEDAPIGTDTASGDDASSAGDQGTSSGVDVDQNPNGDATGSDDPTDTADDEGDAITPPTDTGTSTDTTPGASGTDGVEQTEPKEPTDGETA